MKKLLLSALFLFLTSTNAYSENAEAELFDCNFATETAEQAVVNKSKGITLEQMREYTAIIPASSLKSVYVFYTELGYKFDDQAQAHEAALNSCSKI
jgi:hypothetical protein